MASGFPYSSSEDEDEDDDDNETTSYGGFLKSALLPHLRFPLIGF